MTDLAQHLRDLAGVEPHPLRNAHLESALLQAYRAGEIITREEARPALTFHQPHPGGRILLMLGQHQIGAVFPPPKVTTLQRPMWEWIFWLSSASACSPNGKAKTEQAAKNALRAEARDWLHKAGVA